MRVLALVLLAACGDGSKPAAMIDAMPSIDADDTAYSAHALIGGLDRIVIVKRAETTCFGIVLRGPGGADPDLALPAGWEHESSYARQPATACAPPFEGSTADFESTARTGTIQWTASNVYPASIASIDVTLAFANPPSWCPPSVQLTATAVPVN